MKLRPFAAVVGGLTLVGLGLMLALAPSSAVAAQRVVLAEDFMATW